MPRDRQPKSDGTTPFTVAELRGLFESTPWPVGFYRGPDHVIELLNPAFSQVTVARDEDVLGRPYAEVFPELVAQGVVALLDRVYATGEPFSGKGMYARVVLADGSVREGWWDFALTPWRDAAGRVAGIIASSIEVTDQVKARLAAEAQSRRMALLADAGAVLASSLDYAETLEHIARLPVPSLGEWCIVNVVTPDGWVDRVAVTHADPAQAPVAESLRRGFRLRPDARRGVSRVIARGEAELASSVDEELLQAIARDEAHLAALRALGMRSYVSAPMMTGARVLGAITLATSRRSYEVEDRDFALELARRAALAIDNARLYASQREAVERLRSLQQVTSELSRARTAEEVATVSVRLGAASVGAASCALWLRTVDGDLRLAGSYGVPESFMRQWSLLPRSDRSLPAFRVLDSGDPVWVEGSADYARLAPTVLERATEAGRVNAFATLPLGGDGPLGAVERFGVVTFAFASQHRFDPAEQELLRTLTRQCEQALARARLFEAEAEARRVAEAAREEAQVASAAKDEFLAMLGHELRNPLSPILTALELMRLRGDGDSKERRVIERQVEHLTRLVDDLLDVSRVARGKIQLKRAPIELADVVAKAVEMASPLLEQRRHALAIDVEPGLRALADETRIAQVVANLLTNAAKFTDAEGHVAVRARRDGDRAILTVADDGSGIDAELLPRIFDLFVQGRRAHGVGHGGLGLGLTLVRSIVELHGGTVVARSDGPGRGSELEVRLPVLPATPAAATEERPAIAPAPPRPAPQRVLIVDDNVDAAEMLAELLRDAGHDVTVAHDGPSALGEAAAAPFDVAILDIGLPVMDGYELARRLTTDGDRPYLIALTGYGQAHDRARSTAAGFDEHLVKPVDAERLFAAIERVGRAPQ